MKVPSEGDLVFCTKDSFMQGLLSSVGDPWRHVAVLIEERGELSLGEVSGSNQFVARPLEQALSDYDRVAVGRTSLSPTVLNKAAAWVGSYLGSPQCYAWDDVLLTGFILLTRRGLSSRSLPALGEVLKAVVDVAPKAEHPSMTCSAFVYEAFRHAGESLNVSLDDRLPEINRRALNLGLRSLLDLEGGRLDASLQASSLYELVFSELESVDSDGGELLGDPDSQIIVMPPAAIPSGHGGSQATPAQLYRMTKVVGQLISEYLKAYGSLNAYEYETAISPRRDGRWVSPGDLWRSTSIVERWWLKGSEEELWGSDQGRCKAVASGDALSS